MSEIITDALRALGGEATIEQICHWLLYDKRLQGGAKDYRHSVTNRLWDLKKRGFVEQMASGKWRLLKIYRSPHGSEADWLSGS